MYSIIHLNEVKVERSPALQTEAYRVTFSLSDRYSKPPNPDVNAPKQVDETLCLTSGLLTVELPTSTTTETEVIVKARKTLHEALIRLAEVAKPLA